MLAEDDGGQIQPGESLWSLLQEGGEEEPDRPAVIAMHQKPEHLEDLVGLSRTRPAASLSPATAKHLVWTYSQLRTAVLKVAVLLGSRDIAKGSVLVTFIPNCVECALFMHLAALLELVYVPLDIQTLNPARKEELRFLLVTLKPDVIAVQDQAGIEAIETLRRDVAFDLKLGICLTTSIQNSGTPWNSLTSLSREDLSKAREMPDSFLKSVPDLDQVLLIMFTSGTSTGRPKGCPRTARNWMHSLANKYSLGTIDRSSTAIVTSANFRIIFHALSMTVWTNGGTLVIPGPSFAPESCLDAIETCKGTVMGPVPFQAYLLAAHPAYSPGRVSSLRYVYMGGDVITTAEWNRARSIFPRAQVICIHGMTEGGGVIGWPKGTDFDSLPLFGDVVSCGRTLPGAKNKIVGLDGQTSKRGETGELHLGGLGSAQRYLNDVSPELFYEDAGVKWLITGDSAVMDDDGYVFILGRIKDIIKRGAIPVAPAALESCLYKYANVRVS